MTERIVDLVRELKKARSTLRQVDRMMSAEAEMNAAKHLNSDVLRNPLASQVKATIDGLDRIIALYHRYDDDITYTPAARRAIEQGRWEDVVVEPGDDIGDVPFDLLDRYEDDDIEGVPA